MLSSFANLSIVGDYNDGDVFSLRKVDAHSVDGCYITVIEVELVLRHLNNISPGIDSIPTWVFRSCVVACELADPVADILAAPF